MTETKRFYWLKLKEDFFRQKEIKKLRKLAGGDTFTVIYLKMLLRSLKDNGRLYYEGIESDFPAELALDIDEDEDNVRVTVAFLLANRILLQNQDEYELLTAQDMTGSESNSAARVRRMRANQHDALPVPRAKAKTNAERQRSFRAKQNCEKRHIPMIEDYTNLKRYNGNYYIVFQRDRYQCAMCGSTDNLCVHHIDGYSEDKPENNEANKMVALCRKCHSQVHSSSIEIPQDLLDAIGYDDGSNVTCNAPVTLSNGPVTDSNTEIEIEIDKRDRDRERPAKRTRFTPPTESELTAYAAEKGYTRFNADRFLAYYESNGWKVGRNPMRDWKAAVRGWASRDESPQAAPQAKRNPSLDYTQRENTATDYSGLYVDLTGYADQHENGSD